MPVRLDILVEVFVFALVVALSVAVSRSVESMLDVKRRLGRDAPGLAAGSNIVRQDNPQSSFLQWVQSSSSIKEGRDRQKLRRDLAMAGFEQPSAPIWYVIARFAVDWYLAGRHEVEVIGGETIFLPGKGRGDGQEHV